MEYILVSRPRPCLLGAFRKGQLIEPTLHSLLLAMKACNAVPPVLGFGMYSLAFFRTFCFKESLDVTAGVAFWDALICWVLLVGLGFAFEAGLDCRFDLLELLFAFLWERDDDLFCFSGARDGPYIMVRSTSTLLLIRMLIFFQQLTLCLQCPP